MNISLLSGETVLPVSAVHPDTPIETLKLIVEAELNIPSSQCSLLFRGVALNPAHTLAQAGITNDEIIEVRRVVAGTASVSNPLTSTSASPSTSGVQSTAAAAAAGRPLTIEDIPPALFRDASAFQRFVRANPSILEQFRVVNPQIAHACTMSDVTLLTQILNQIVRQQEERARAERERIALLNADPFDLDAQARIAEQIRLEQVEQNMSMAMEHAPETFARVIMLYVPMKVNGHQLAAFVDSGAQSTIMSAACAERVGILRLIDRRFAGIAKGVGTSRILGRVHQVQVQIGEQFIATSFTILENQDMDVLFGLDQLKKHQCSIDLKENCLVLYDKKIPFLPEKDLPAHARESGNETHEDSKTTITTVHPPVPNTNTNTNTNTTTTSSGSQASPSSVTPSPVPATASVGANPSTLAPSSSASTSSTVSVLEDKIRRLVELGFPRDQAIAALQMTGGNEEAAASYLMGFD